MPTALDMVVLVVGGGAREHALCLALSKDPSVATVVCAPGNAGIAAVAEVRGVDPLDGAAVAALAVEVGADLVVIGPEAPLVAGVADAVRAAGINCFGPSAAAARLEGSKVFAKDVMAAAGVPTARARLCETADQVAAALEEFGPPHVVKDDGLAAGKGVVVTDDPVVAAAHAAHCGRVVIEEFLDGPEISVFGVCDGSTVVPLMPSQDFKRVADGDLGPNTGGMGAYAPLPWAPAELLESVLRDILQPTVDEMRRRGTPFSGLLYAGLALTSAGVRVIEFNARFGDPETQVVLALLDSPIAGLLAAAATGTLAAHPPLRWRPGAAVTVVIAAAGYPEQPRGGDPITGLDLVPAPAYVLHAGTAGRGGEVVSAGGRVLSVTAVGADLAAARDAAYAGVAAIGLAGSHHRTDVAQLAADTHRSAEISYAEELT
jgi:phosphoribosylamine--glycine ligase